MKILRIVSSGFEEGGVENGIVLMQPILMKKGHEVRIMASNRRMDLPHYDDYRFKAINPNSIMKYVYHAFNPYSLFLLRKVLKEYQPDIVQLHTMGQPSSSVLFLLRHTPTVLTIHGPEAFTPSLLLWYLPTTDFKDHSHNRDQLTIAGKFHYFYHTYLTTPLYRLGLRNVDAIVVFSHYMQQLMQKDGMTTRYIPNATTLLDQKPLPNNEVLAYAGRLEKFKGIDHLLRAMPDILKQRPNARLLIAGDGNYRKDLEKLMDELQLNKSVEFLGHLSRAEVKALYEKSVMLILPSIWPEAFGKVGIEAMSVGRPVVASDVGGVSDWLIDGKTGYLVPPGRPEALSEAILRLLTNRAKLEEMAVNARKRSEDFTLERHTEMILELYREIIQTYSSKKK